MRFNDTQMNEYLLTLREASEIINWPSGRMLGRSTINPKIFLKNPQDGKESGNSHMSQEYLFQVARDKKEMGVVRGVCCWDLTDRVQGTVCVGVKGGCCEKAQKLFLGSGAWSVLLGLNGPCAGDCVRGSEGGCCEKAQKLFLGSGAWSVLLGLNGPCAGDCVRGSEGRGGCCEKAQKIVPWYSGYTPTIHILDPSPHGGIRAIAALILTSTGPTKKTIWPY
ncbi:hypothetical protein CDAR_436591 [Caerostris darwini]|uniref:Uncharacterized protein n=1 Tax=Caerostris darwini TaxID=1538125 RepID=A0AAV4SIH9_9ARAC|nr:hypothetical protein CDAR_436591 [Caerostris darwini]